MTTGEETQSWRGYERAQHVDWGDPARLTATEQRLRGLPPLVFAGEIRQLQEQLAEAARGDALVLQAGDCAESFHDLNADVIKAKLNVILQMAAILTYSTGKPIVKIGRIAGQYGKPRSNATETIDGIELPSFRGHIVNSEVFDPQARKPNPERMLQSYHSSAASLNLLRAFTTGGFASLERAACWAQEFAAGSAAGSRYRDLADGIQQAIEFMQACGITSETNEQLRTTTLYTSHEALILEYEEALTREDSLTRKLYDCSAHMLWIGERTRQIDGAHVEMLRHVENPIGVKLGPRARIDDALRLCEKLNPGREAGRLTLISRMGAQSVEERLPPLVEAVYNAGHPVLWLCDPMHGNTISTTEGRKTRRFETIIAELESYVSVMNSCGVPVGGIHVELTGEDVTECVGGIDALSDEDLCTRYETICDPRLNGRQAVELAFRAAELLRHPERLGR